MRPWKISGPNFDFFWPIPREYRLEQILHISVLGFPIFGVGINECWSCGPMSPDTKWIDLYIHILGIQISFVIDFY